MATSTADEERGADRAAWALAVASGALVAQHVAGRATRDALYLSHFDVSTLPGAMIGAAALSAVAVLGTSRLLARSAPERVVPFTFALAAGLFLCEWALAARDERAAALVVYAHTAVFGAAAGSSFWSMVNERFDPHVGKRVVGRIASGATIGGVVGGLLAWRAAAVLPVPVMLALLAGINMIGACFATAARKRGRGRAPATAETAASGLRVLADTPYLRDLGLLVLTCAAAQALLEYLVSARAAAIYGKGPALLGFFALYNLGVSVVTFFAQAGLVRPSLERRGLAGTLVLHPVTVGAAAVLAAIAPGLGTAIVARGAEAVARNSVFRSAYELLYTPLPPAEKRATKTLIDVGLDRVGTALGSGAILALGYALREHLPTLLALVTLGLMAAGYSVSRRLHHGYVDALARSLKSGAVVLPEDAAEDLDTRRTLAETTALLDRRKLLEKIGEYQRAKRERSPLGGTGPREIPSDPGGLDADPPPSLSAPRTAPPDDPIVTSIARLLSGDPKTIRAELRTSVDPRVLIHVVRLLDDDAVVRDAARALRRAAPRISGMLVDALLDPESTEKVRRRVTRVLKVCRTQRVADGLVAALEDPVFDVRDQAGVTLAQMADEAAIAIPREAIFAVTRRELSARRSSWSLSRGARVPDDKAILRGLTHVFRLLGLAVEREPLAVSLRALRSDDTALRGTAREFLEVVLPEDIRETLFPLLEEAPRLSMPTGEEPANMAETLSRSHDAAVKRAGSTS